MLYLQSRKWVSCICTLAHHLLPRCLKLNTTENFDTFSRWYWSWPNMDSLLIYTIKIENNRVHVLPTEISPTPHEDLICQLQDQDTRVQTDEIDVLKWFRQKQKVFVTMRYLTHPLCPRQLARTNHGSITIPYATRPLSPLLEKSTIVTLL